MICKCGFQNEEGDLYCAQCGRKLSKKKSRGKGWIIALALVIVVAIGAAAGYFAYDAFFAGDDPETESEPERCSDATEDEEEEENASGEEVTASEEVRADGWDEGRLHYYRKNEPLTGLQELEGEWYFFDDTGLVQTGWVENEGVFHFFTDNGPSAQAGWYSDELGWFCLEEKGRLISNTTFRDGENPYKSYFINEQGYLYQVMFAQMECIQEKASIGEMEREVLMTMEPVINCNEITVRATTAELQNAAAGNWNLWIQVDGQWQNMAGKFNCYNEPGSGLRVAFTEEVSFDGFCLFHNTLNISVSTTIYSITMKY